jgi:putative tricarboxylic transport membrane protein
MDKYQKFGIVLFILSVFTLFFILPNQVSGGSRALLYPRLVVIWISFFAIVMIFKKTKRIEKKEVVFNSNNSNNKQGYWRVIRSFIIAVIYIYAIDFIGFFVSSFLFLFFLMWNVNVRSLFKLLIYPFIALSFLYLLVEKVLLFPLPDGFLF